MPLQYFTRVWGDAVIATSKGRGPRTPRNLYPCKVGAFWRPVERGQDRLQRPLGAPTQLAGWGEPDAPLGRYLRQV
jgi:hypothetical protein